MTIVIARTKGCKRRARVGLERYSSRGKSVVNGDDGDDGAAKMRVTMRYQGSGTVHRVTGITASHRDSDMSRHISRWGGSLHST